MFVPAVILTITIVLWFGSGGVCVLPGFPAANYSDCSAAGGSVVCRQLLPVDPSPAQLLVGIWLSAIRQTDTLTPFLQAI